MLRRGSTGFRRLCQQWRAHQCGHRLGRTGRARGRRRAFCHVGQAEQQFTQLGTRCRRIRLWHPVAGQHACGYLCGVVGLPRVIQEPLGAHRQFERRKERSAVGVLLHRSHVRRSHQARRGGSRQQHHLVVEQLYHRREVTISQQHHIDIREQRSHLCVGRRFGHVDVDTHCGRCHRAMAAGSTEAVG